MTPNLASEASPRCYVCGKDYQGASKPVWVLADTGELLGSAHTSCAQYRNLRAFAGDTLIEDARFTLWRWYVARPERDSDAYFAAALADRGRGQDLNDDQKELLDWWIFRGSLKLGERRGQPIIDAYRRLLEQYQAWRAQVTDRDAAHA